MHSGFVLLEAAPGRERDVLERIARVPEVTAKQVLFGSSIAVRLAGPPKTLPRAVARLRRFAGVRAATWYPGSA